MYPRHTATLPGGGGTRFIHPCAAKRGNYLTPRGVWAHAAPENF